MNSNNLLSVDIIVNKIISCLAGILDWLPLSLRLLIYISCIFAILGIVISFYKAVKDNCHKWKSIENNELTYSYFCGTGFFQYKMIYAEAFSLLVNWKWFAVSYAGLGNRLGNYKNDSEFISFALSLLYIPLTILGFIEMSIRIICGTLIYLSLAVTHAVTLMLLYLISLILIPILRLQDKIVRVEQHCTHCYASFNMPIICCPNCNAKHKNLLPSNSGALFARCKCGCFIPTISILGRSKLNSICPKCENELPATNARQFSIQLIGGNSSGKTALIAAFQHIYLNCCSESSEIKVFGSPANTFEELEEFYINGVTKPSSASEAVPHNFIHQRDGLSLNNLLIYDIPDEVIISGEYEKNPLNFGYSDGIIILIDPLSIQSVRDQIIKSNEGDCLNGYSEDDPDNLIVQFINQFSRIVGRNAKMMNNVPVAVIITKSDIKTIKREIGFPKITTAYNSNPEKYSNNIEVARNEICKQYLLNLGLANALNNLESVFSNINYFPASAIGHKSNQGEQFTPFGVLEPVIWIAKNKHSKLANFINNTLHYISDNDFQDEATTNILREKYAQAKQLYELGELNNATKAFCSLGKYRDSQEWVGKIREKRYKIAINLLTEKNYDEAIKEFRLLGDYKDSQEYVKRSIYQKALFMLDNKQFDKSLELFFKLSEYKDSKIQIKNVYYKRAEFYISIEDYIAAYDQFMSISDFKDSKKRAEGILTSAIKVGKKENIIFAGRSWNVIAIENEQAMLMTQSILEKKAFNISAHSAKWDESSLRKYLNGELFNSFPTKDKARIICHEYTNESNPESQIMGCNNTSDFISLLSIEEVKKYFSNDTERIACYGNTPESWSLRSIGGDQNHHAIIDEKGHINYGGNKSETPTGIRPIIWIDCR